MLSIYCIIYLRRFILNCNIIIVVHHYTFVFRKTREITTRIGPLEIEFFLLHKPKRKIAKLYGLK